MRLAVVLIVVAGTACSPPPQARDARASFNSGKAMIASGDFGAGIELLAASRANAGGDREARFRASFALGESYAAWAEQVLGEKPKDALERYQRSESWFRDAIRLREDSTDARVNLAIVIRKRRALADQLDAGNKGLEKQLEAVLADQRATRDELRQGETALARGADPAMLAPTFAALATRERTLSADVGVVADIAADERADIEAIAEADRTPEQSGRLAQLAALGHYLERARGAMAAARRSLRTDRVERGHRRAEAAVSELVRAREQLLDPAAVIQALAGDELLLYRETRVLASLRSGDIALAGDEAPSLPPHLAGDRLSERQRFIHERASELSARLSAYAVSSAADGEPQEAAQLREVVSKAAPFLAAAVADMNAAATQLAADEAGAAANSEEQVLTNLARALEYFSGLRQLIELIHAEQSQAVGLLDPSTAGSSMSTADRSRRLGEIATLNRERLERLAMLLVAEKARGLEEAKKAAGENPEDDGGAAIEARFAKAETHRLNALQELEAMTAALASRGDALAPGKRTITELDELRRLFFSLIEHLKDLHQRQGVTRDNTATAHGSDDEDRALLLPPLASAETEHAGLAGQIGEALAAQADKAAATEAQGQGGMPGGPDASKLSAAADEVRQATNRMQVAGQKLGEAITAAQTMSVDLEPTLGDQAAAIEHLAKAIELLSPPQKQDKQDKQQDKQQDQQDEQEQDPQEQDQQQEQQQPSDDLSQSDVDRRLRAIREREDERRRERQREPRRQTVEKDW